MEGCQRRFVAMTAKLDAMSPLKVLTRGYALVSNEQGQLIRSVEQVQPDDRVTLRLSDGQLHARITGGTEHE